jgi:DNA topoisomerase-1
MVTKPKTKKKAAAEPGAKSAKKAGEKAKTARKARRGPKSVVIVESPAKARTINRYLGSDFVVKASMGHVRDLPAKKFGVDIENGFEPEYVTIRGRGKALAELRKIAKGAERVYMATDLDREGEAIAWHLCRALDLTDEEALRVTFNEITEAAIHRAFDTPSKIDARKVDAQQARRILDRIVGYKLSPLLWKKVTRGLSAGRVQSVAVRLIVEREREIEAFVPEEYWKLVAILSPDGEEATTFAAELKKVDGEKAAVPDEARATKITEALRRADYRVASVKRKAKTERPHPPYITSTLQQQASIRLRFTAKKTMMVAQQLYEGIDLGTEGSVGLITYMRTDSVNLADSSIEDAREFIASEFPSEYLPEKPIRYRSRKDAQGAHEAIRPTAAKRTPTALSPYLTPDQLKLYRLIWERFVACQMTPARLEMTEVEVEGVVADPGEEEPSRGLFRATGRRTLFDGYTRVASSRRRDDQELPALEEEAPLELMELNPTQHFTQPPPRYTEATLVKTLEREGIGRPSTYAPIISTIQDRGYVNREKGRFHATELGAVVNDLLMPYFHEIMDIGFTSQMESRLDEIEARGANWREILGEFYEAFSKDLETAEAKMKDLKKEPEVSDEKCEKCGSPMIYKWYRKRKFLACSGFPDCRNTKSVEGDEPREKPVETDVDCPQCGEKMLLRTGRRGKFLGCSKYPKCKGTLPVDKDDNPIRLPEVDETCEKCGKPMVAKMGRRGPFIACTGFPRCRNTKPMEKEGAEAPKKESEGGDSPDEAAPSEA